MATCAHRFMHVKNHMDDMWRRGKRLTPRHSDASKGLFFLFERR